MEILAESYPLIDGAAYLCKTGPTFSKPVADDEPIADEATEDDEDDDARDEAKALMVFDQGGDED